MRPLPTLALALFSLVTGCAPKATRDFGRFLAKQPQNTFDVLLLDGQVIDGTGQKAFAADVLIRHDTIAFVGEVDPRLVQVQKTIDARGKVVSPGFIDTHAHGDPLGERGFLNFLAQGATTVTLGNDGAHPQNLQSWMQRVDQAGSEVNIALFVGHGTLRQEAGLNYDSLPTQAQLEKMGQLLREKLDLGCLGLSTGLEYLPGFYAPPYELEYLAKEVGAKGKLITSHVRNEDDQAIEASLNELLLQGKHCPVHVSHLKVVFGKGKARAEQILDQLEQARQRGIRVTADVYPYTASFTGISILFPEWALPPHSYEQVVATRRQELLEYLRNRVNKRNGPQATLLGTAPFAGKTLAQLAQEKQKPFEEVLLEDIGPGGASAAYFVMDEALQARFIVDPTVMICSDGGPDMRHPRGYGSFARILEAYVVRTKQLSLEEAIRKMTSLSARTMGLADRGEIAVGKKADLLVFDPAQVHETTTYENPFQLATGFETVLVNGKVSVENGRLVQKNGKVLRKF
ncbi:N-acyl-D-amino-acid deacylase family protein [Rufibacter psychrotolerans]|uniref:N-acyl-D-amino-acid deacylase family protein n=1 Tax=Rufibacter psychrotolerans TaxID=2812556 RepID=UPI0019673D80|nr:amidohydrolase family protein [Rufibacter sp. SYSU D00308]